MATAQATIPASRLHGHHDRPSMVSVGTIIWLSSELMFFAALFASYFTIRAASPDLWAQETQLLNVPFSTANTIIPVLSSVTCQLGVFAAERGRVARLGSVLNVGGWGLREWFILTYIMGAIFIGGRGAGVCRADPRGRHHPELCLRHDVLPHHRLPRHSRDRRPDRVPLRSQGAPISPVVSPMSRP
ncbi:cytochrome c oxidase subunit 3 [Nocardioides sp. B-3]|uniref:cytochrome c oxidase subunit 3 n=1 Tax=Nocardioides sp. B-3 TaxID=2895565 RepID=UPI003FA5A45A